MELQRHPWARLAWRRAKRGASLYCSGLDFALPVKDAQVLAGTEQIGAALYQKLSAKGRDAVQALVAGGFYQLVDDAGFEDEDDYVAEYDIVDGTDAVEVIDDEAIQADVHEVTIHDDGIEVIVDFDDSDEADGKDEPPRG